MLIVTPKVIPIRDIPSGDCFYYEADYWIKSGHIDTVIHAINLNTGKYEHIRLDQPVTPVKAKVVIE